MWNIKRKIEGRRKKDQRKIEWKKKESIYKWMRQKKVKLKLKDNETEKIMQ